MLYEVITIPVKGESDHFPVSIDDGASRISADDIRGRDEIHGRSEIEDRRRILPTIGKRPGVAAHHRIPGLLAVLERVVVIVHAVERRPWRSNGLV